MRKLNDVVFVSAVRTPMGRYGGTLRDMPVYEMGAFPAREAMKRANVNGDEIDESIKRGFFLLLLSENSLKSKFVMQEVEYAFNKSYSSVEVEILFQYH